MSRYFIEVAYKGTNYAGFQKQDNANTIQAEVESALTTYFRSNFILTGSSRTDAGVHALQNFFHFDHTEFSDSINLSKATYHLNAILPLDIVIKSFFQVKDDAHSRFDAISRSYQYRIYQNKNPFLQDSAFYFPFAVNHDILQALANELRLHNDFQSFSKKNSQVFTYNCQIIASEWIFKNNELIFSVCANRFLRGMVKGLVGTMLYVASRRLSINAFRDIIYAKDSSKANFAVPPHALTLINVHYKAL